MDPRSESLLEHVHPDLVKVARGTAQAPQPFIVVYGIRSLAAEAKAVATGHSQTMRSRHLPDAHYPGPLDPRGLALAIDVAALINGQVSFAPGKEQSVFGLIAAQMKASAARLKVPLQWGGDPVGAWTPGVVSHFRDWGHFQLPWLQYP